MTKASDSKPQTHIAREFEITTVYDKINLDMSGHRFFLLPELAVALAAALKRTAEILRPELPARVAAKLKSGTQEADPPEDMNYGDACLSADGEPARYLIGGLCLSYRTSGQFGGFKILRAGSAAGVDAAAVLPSNYELDAALAGFYYGTETASIV
ncbi:MAG: hypothetical protein ACREBU_01815 [Nitrososphaera sp.]